MFDVAGAEGREGAASIVSAARVCQLCLRRGMGAQPARAQEMRPAVTS